MLKKSISIILVVFMVLTLVLSGCGSKPEEKKEAPKTDAKEEKKEEKVTLDFYTYARWNGIKGNEADGKLGDWQKEAAKKFMAKYPNVTINVETLNFQGGPEKVNIAIESGNLPDVIEDVPARVFEYAYKGLIVPLDEYVDKDYLNDIEPSIWAQMTIGDSKHYMLPWGVSPQVMLINKSKFKEAGAENLLPKNQERTWTHDEFVKALKAVTAKGDISGASLFAKNGSGDSFIFNWLWSCGAKAFSDTYDKVAINDVKGVAGMKFIKRLVDEKLTNPGIPGVTASDTGNLFNQQKVVASPQATIGYARAVNAMKAGQIAKFDIEAFMYPGEKPATFVHTFGFSVFKNKDANRQKWAIEFAKFLANKDNAGAIRASSSFSPRKSMVDLYKDENDPNMNFAAKTIKYAVDGGLATPGFNQQREAFVANHYQAMLLGKKSPEDALKDYEAEANKIISEAKSKFKK